ncbi:heterotrimeric G protein alpha subunit A [Mycena sanguinolenta]|nr:heterotrimeric G protein alpha subunit A [Mycena sanguinolenta]
MKIHHGGFSPGYTLTEEDVLHASPQRTSITETRLDMRELSVYMYDVGNQFSERTKWIHCFESVTSIIFCTALSEYDKEQNGQNSMRESLVLFESIVNSRWFLHTSIILFLFKFAAFRVKIKEVPLERYFPEYTDGVDVNKATQYIKRRFMRENRARLTVYSHVAEATAEDNVRVVFAAIQDTILRNNLKAFGLI